MKFRTIYQTLQTIFIKSSPLVKNVAEKRRAEFLAGLALFFGVINILGLIIGSRSGNPLGSIVLLIFSITLIIAYILSRSRHYRVGIWLVIGLYSTVTFGYALSGSTTNGPLIAFALFLPLVLTFGAAWLELRNLAIFLGLILIGYLLSPRLEPSLSGPQFLLLFGILTAQSILLLVTQNYRDLIESDRTKVLRLSESRLRGIIESAPNIILETDRDGLITLANRNKDQYLNKNIRDLVLPKDIELLTSAMDQALTKGQYQSFEIQTSQSNGNDMWNLFRIGPIVDQGKVNSLAFIIADITEQKLAEQERENMINELEARNTELTQFAYTVSHELKTPVVTIKGYIGSIGNDLKEKLYERVEKDLQRVSSAADKLHKTLSDLLDLSRVGRLMNKPENMPFAKIVDDALELMHGHIEMHNITTKTAHDLPVIYGDHQRLTEVLQNLIENATKYLGDQTDPLIEIGQQGNDVERGQPIFYVKDNGIGIAPEYHERIFGLFNKLDAKSDGTGVGLALVKRIIEIHGGRIWVDSEIGKGATFYFTLPSA
ncbi:MAG TPA: ATP-binding protein [Anaerolineales bacterium]|nr:ATP-binding protein [Anaerolineales bacterium]